jgi:hypothetical protein
LRVTRWRRLKDLLSAIEGLALEQRASPSVLPAGSFGRRAGFIINPNVVAAPLSGVFKNLVFQIIKY